jgi:Glycosyltransferase family 87
MGRQVWTSGTVKHSAIAGGQNRPMSRDPESLERASPRALAIAGGVAIGYLAFLGWLLAQHRWVADPSGHPFATDFLSFWSAGHLALNGQAAAAYDWPTMHRLQQQLMHRDEQGYFGWAYPPLFLPVAMLLALISYMPSFLLWVGATLALYAFTIARVTSDRGAGLIACAAPAALGCAMVGQNGLLSAALIGCALIQLEKRPLMAGLLIGLLTYKPHLGLLIPIALLFGGYWRAFLAAMASALVILAFSWWLAPDSLMAFVHHMGGMSDSFLTAGTAGYYKQQSLYGLLRMLGAGDHSAFAAQGLLLLAVTGFAAWLWRSGHAFPLKCAGLVTAGLLATPYIYLYDFPILSVAIAFLWRDHVFSRGEWGLILASQLTIAAFILVKAPMGLFAALLVLMVVLGRSFQIKTAPQPRTV